MRSVGFVAFQPTLKPNAIIRAKIANSGVLDGQEEGVEGARKMARSFNCIIKKPLSSTLAGSIRALGQIYDTL